MRGERRRLSFLVPCHSPTAPPLPHTHTHGLNFEHSVSCGWSSPTTSICSNRVVGGPDRLGVSCTKCRDMLGTRGDLSISRPGLMAGAQRGPQDRRPGSSGDGVWPREDKRQPRPQAERLSPWVSLAVSAEGIRVPETAPSSGRGGCGPSD